MRELDKLSAVREKSQICGEFLEWLNRRFVLAEFHAHSNACFDEEGDRRCDLKIDELVPVHRSIEKLLAEFLDIDLGKVENEKRAILAKLQQEATCSTGRRSSGSGRK